MAAASAQMGQMAVAPPLVTHGGTACACGGRFVVTEEVPACGAACIQRSCGVGKALFLFLFLFDFVLGRAERVCLPQPLTVVPHQLASRVAL
jgi:hypothetical protein